MRFDVPHVPALMMRALCVALLIAGAVAAAGSLVAGQGWLEATLPGGLPTGNAVAALAFCLLAGAGLLASRARTWARAWGWSAFVAALAWLPLSIAMAGNPALNFQGARGEAWLLLSLGVLAMSGASLAWAVVAAIWAWSRAVRDRRVGGRG